MPKVALVSFNVEPKIAPLSSLIRTRELSIFLHPRNEMERAETSVFLILEALPPNVILIFFANHFALSSSSNQQMILHRGKQFLCRRSTKLGLEEIDFATFNRFHHRSGFLKHQPTSSDIPTVESSRPIGI